eukprot:1244003-Pyramimonas_sp.AAC.1
MGPVGDFCLAAVTEQLADDAIALGVKESKASFGDWIDAQAAVGGAALRAFAKEPAFNAVAIREVGVPLGKMGAVKALVAEWAAYWRTSAPPPVLRWPQDLVERPERPTADQLRRVFPTFKVSRGKSFDNFSPWDFG